MGGLHPAERAYWPREPPPRVKTLAHGVEIASACKDRADNDFRSLKIDFVIKTPIAEADAQRIEALVGAILGAEQARPASH